VCPVIAPRQNLVLLQLHPKFNADHWERDHPISLKVPNEKKVLVLEPIAPRASKESLSESAFLQLKIREILRISKTPK